MAVAPFSAARGKLKVRVPLWSSANREGHTVTELLQIDVGVRGGAR